MTTTAGPLDPSSEALTLANTGSPSNSPPRRCVFPFIYMGETYTSCTCAVIGRFWCSTTSDFDLDSRWGLCDPDSAFDPDAQTCDAGSFATRVDHPTSPADAFRRFDDGGEAQEVNGGGGKSSAGTAAGIAAGAVGAVLVLFVALAVFRRRNRGMYKVDELPSQQPRTRPAFPPASSKAGASERAVYTPQLTKTVV